MLQISRIHLKDIRHQKSDVNQVPYEEPQILGDTIQNFLATVTWRPEFVHPSLKLHDPIP